MSVAAVVVADVKKFESVLIVVGKDFEKGLTVAVKYLPEADVLAGFIFPAAVAPLTAATTTADLLQKAIVTVEQKYAASNAQTGSGAAKASEVLILTQGAVTTLLSDATVQAGLSKAGIAVNPTYISNLVSAIVGFLNVQGVTA